MTAKPPRHVLHTGAVRESEWNRLITPLLPEDQDWPVQGRRLAYRAPVGRFLFGVLAEGSATKGRRHIWRLTMPLFEPSDVLDLSHSERIYRPSASSTRLHSREPWRRQSGRFRAKRPRGLASLERRRTLMPRCGWRLSIASPPRVRPARRGTPSHPRA